MRRRVGVVGAIDEDRCGGRVGDAGRQGEGGVTSLWRIELNMALACSGGERSGGCGIEPIGVNGYCECHVRHTMRQGRTNVPFIASDSVGMVRCFDGVEGPLSSMR